jgi:hypothetical protein
MPEDEIETQELKESLEEVHEHAHGEHAHGGHAHGGEHAKVGWITWLSLSTAVIAVIAAIASLESGSYANEAIVLKNDAVLHQSKADDAWAHYQAKGIEAAIYGTQSEGARTPELAAKWRATAEREEEARADAKRTAEEEEHAVETADRGSEHSLHVHHQFAKSITIFQVAIALSAIAALTRKRAVWWVSLTFGAVGVVFFALGLLPH